jgi:hypothetical protein
MSITPLPHKPIILNHREERKLFVNSGAEAASQPDDDDE